MFRPKNAQGFTLIELLVVIAIVGILASVVMVSLDGAKKSARDRERISNLQQVQVALRVHRDANSTSDYPVYTNGDLIGDGVGIDTIIAPYLAGTIRDPLNVAPYQFFYDSAYECGGVPRVVLIAQAMEEASSGNYESACADTASNLGNGVTPTASSYIVILK